MPLPKDENGNLLIIDLNEKRTQIEDIPPETHRKYLLGLGYNTLILNQKTNNKTDPFSKENVVIISPGILTGTDAPASCRLEVTTKSPLTGILGTGNSGGYWGPSFKRAGYDSLVIQGASNKPLYIIIEDQEIQFLDAKLIWGLDVYKAIDQLSDQHGSEFSQMVIGPAGERLVRFAAPVFDKQHMPGRCHAGGVLGSKKLKAVLVKGSGKVEPRDSKAFQKALRTIEERIKSYPAWKARARAGSMGTIGITEKGIDYDDIVVPYLKRGKPGSYCPCSIETLYGCNLIADVKEGPYSGVDVACAGLTLYSGTAERYGVSLPAAFYINELCQKLGMDMFGPFFYIYELVKRGIITEKHLGFSLEPGNEEDLMRLIKMVGYREGFGDILAEGSSRIAKIIGDKATKYSPIVKGLEVMTPDPRVDLKENIFTSMSILTNPRGGDDLKGTHGVSNYPGHASWAKKLGIPKRDHSKWIYEWIDMPSEYKKKVFGDPADTSNPDELLITIWYNHLTSVYNSLGVCMFASSVAEVIGPTHLADLYSAATGNQISAEEIMETGERIFNLMRVYINRQGITAEDDHWPEIYYEEPGLAGEDKSPPFSRTQFQKELDRYYKIRGWDSYTGKPLPETLKKLGIDLEEE
jgi:aldehyde:ferredoxin oxidoreductase